MPQPLISFCMSTYKRPELLQIQLQRLLQQTYENIEIIISDNDTEQSAKPIVKEINDKRVKYFPNAINLGMVKSFNASIQRSSGEYIVMITDDDPAYNYMLTDLIELVHKHPGYGVYGGYGDWVVENEFAAKSMAMSVGTRSYLLKSIPENDTIITEASEFAAKYLNGLFSQTFLLWSCLMIERPVMLEIGGMPDYGSELLTDHAMVIAAGSKKGMVFVNKAMGAQVVHGNNFGYDIFKLQDKYINTPKLFHGYLKSQLQNNNNWKFLNGKIWDFAGRAWVEYTLQITKSRANSQQKKEFNRLINKAFANRNISKWKYKYYLKQYCRPLFNLLLSTKNIWR